MASKFDYSADVAIIGSGVAGSIIATQLAKSGIKVIVLEAGIRFTRQEALARQQAAWKVDNSVPYPRTQLAPLPIPGDVNDDYVLNTGPVTYIPNYLRGIGGSTWHWQSVAFRQAPDDMEMNTRYGLGIDWPISYNELEPFFSKAEIELGVSGNSDHDLGSPRSGPYPMESVVASYADTTLASKLNELGLKFLPRPAARNSAPYDGRPACFGYHNCSKICPVGAQYSGDVHVNKAEGFGAKFLENALVTSIEINDDNQVSYLKIKRENGQEQTVGAKIFVAAANGVETPRLFLYSSNEQRPHGIANTSGLVGKGLMDHVSTILEFDAKEPIFPGRGPETGFGEFSQRSGEQRKQRAAYNIVIENPELAVPVAAKLISAGLSGDELDSALRKAVARRVTIQVQLEQLPDDSNQISLNYGELDSAGIPKMSFHYSVDGYTLRGQKESFAKLQQIAKFLGGTNLLRSDIFPGAHPTGTLRMGHDKNKSVTDNEGRTHDHENLFVAGSALFPTCGTANPTLTIAALALRTADAIQKQFTKR